MNKCKKCGKEFEGKFCPECGEKAVQPVFEELGAEPQAEASTAAQQFDLKSLGKKKLFQLRFVSNFTERISGYLLLAIILIEFAAFVLVSAVSRNVFFEDSYGVEDVTTAEPYIIAASVLGVVCIIIIATFIIAMLNKKPILNYAQMLTRRKQFKRCGGAIILLVVFEAFNIAFYVCSSDKMVGMLFLTIIYPVLIAAHLSTTIIGIKTIDKIEKEYVITDADGNTQDNLTLISNASVQELKNLNITRTKECNAKREAMGQAPKTAREVERQYFFKEMYKKISTAAVLVILVSVIFIVSIALPRDIFNTEKIEKLSVGDSMGYITRMLGEPYDKKEIKDSQDKVKSCTYYYCSSPLADDIAKINKKLEKFEDAEDFDDLEEMIELSEKLANLEEKLSKISCDYIEVSFENNKVNSVCLQKNCFYGDNLNSEVTKITYADANGKKYYKYGNTITAEKGKEEITVNARLYFGDGSLLNKQIKVKLNSGQTGVQNLTWSDSFGTHEIIVNLI